MGDPQWWLLVAALAVAVVIGVRSCIRTYREINREIEACDELLRRIEADQGGKR